MEMMDRRRPSVDGHARDALRSFVENWMRTRPPGRPSERQIAIHEAAHYWAFEAFGMVAGLAHLDATNGRSSGGSGGAGCMERPAVDRLPHRTLCTTKDLGHKAMSCIADPAAEQIFAGGYFYASPGEVLETCIMAVRVARLENISRKQAVLSILTGTIAVLDGHRDALEDLANLLEKRREIARHKRPVALILAHIRKRSPDQLPEPRPERVVQRVKLIAGAPVNLEVLLARLP